MNHIKTIAQELGLNEKAVEAAVNLIDEGNTIPFIARYRKEATGSMDDQVLRKLGERLDYLRGLDKRRDEVKRSIEEQGAMTEELATEAGGCRNPGPPGGSVPPLPPQAQNPRQRGPRPGPGPAGRAAAGPEQRAPTRRKQPPNT